MKTIRITLTGGFGLLGNEVGRALECRGYELDVPPHEALDITQRGDVLMYLSSCPRADLVINCALLTQRLIKLRQSQHKQI